MLAAIRNFLGKMFTAWLMRPLYIAIIAILILVVIYMVYKQKGGK